MEDLESLMTAGEYDIDLPSEPWGELGLIDHGCDDEGDEDCFIVCI